MLSGSTLQLGVGALRLGTVRQRCGGLDHQVGFACWLPVSCMNYRHTGLPLSTAVRVTGLCSEHGPRWFECALCRKVGFDPESPLTPCRASPCQPREPPSWPSQGAARRRPRTSCPPASDFPKQQWPGAHPSSARHLRAQRVGQPPAGGSHT